MTFSSMGSVAFVSKTSAIFDVHFILHVGGRGPPPKDDGDSFI